MKRTKGSWDTAGDVLLIFALAWFTIFMFIPACHDTTKDQGPNIHPKSNDYPKGN